MTAMMDANQEGQYQNLKSPPSISTSTGASVPLEQTPKGIQEPPKGIQEPPNDNNTYTLDPIDNTYKNIYGDTLPASINIEETIRRSGKEYIEQLQLSMENVLNADLLVNAEFERLCEIFVRLSIKNNYLTSINNVYWGDYKQQTDMLANTEVPLALKGVLTQTNYKLNNLVSNIKILNLLRTVNTNTRYGLLIKYKQLYSQGEDTVVKDDKKYDATNENDIKEVGLKTSMDNIDQTIKDLESKYGDDIIDDDGILDKFEMLQKILINENEMIWKLGIFSILDGMKVDEQNPATFIQSGIMMNALDESIKSYDNPEKPVDNLEFVMKYFEYNKNLTEILIGDMGKGSDVEGLNKTQMEEYFEELTEWSKKEEAAVKIQARVRGNIARNPGNPGQKGGIGYGFIATMILSLAVTALQNGALVQGGVVVPASAQPQLEHTSVSALSAESNVDVTNFSLMPVGIGKLSTNTYITDVNFQMPEDYKIIENKDKDDKDKTTYTIYIDDIEKGREDHLDHQFYTVNKDGKIIGDVGSFGSDQYTKINSHSNSWPVKMKYLVNTDIKSLHTFIKEYTADKGDFITDFTEKLEQSIVFRVVPEESRAIILANCIEIIGKNKDLNFDLNVENLIKFQIAAEVTTQDKVDELSGKDKVDIIYANIGLSPLSILQDPADRLQLLQLAHTAGVNMKIFHDPGAINLLSVKQSQLITHDRTFVHTVSVGDIKTKRMLGFFDQLLVDDVKDVDTSTDKDKKTTFLEVIKTNIEKEKETSGMNLLQIRDRFRKYVEDKNDSLGTEKSVTDDSGTIVTYDSSKQPEDVLSAQIYRFMDTTITKELVKSVKHYNDNQDQANKYLEQFVDHIFATLSETLPDDSVVQRDEGYIYNTEERIIMDQSKLFEELNKEYKDDAEAVIEVDTSGIVAYSSSIESGPPVPKVTSSTTVEDSSVAVISSAGISNEEVDTKKLIFYHKMRAKHQLAAFTPKAELAVTNGEVTVTWTNLNGGTTLTSELYPKLLKILELKKKETLNIFATWLIKDDEKRGLWVEKINSSKGFNPLTDTTIFTIPTDQIQEATRRYDDYLTIHALAKAATDIFEITQEVQTAAITYQPQVVSSDGQSTTLALSLDNFEIIKSSLDNSLRNIALIGEMLIDSDGKERTTAELRAYLAKTASEAEAQETKDINARQIKALKEKVASEGEINSLTARSTFNAMVSRLVKTEWGSTAYLLGETLASIDPDKIVGSIVVIGAIAAAVLGTKIMIVAKPIIYAGSGVYIYYNFKQIQQFVIDNPAPAVGIVLSLSLLGAVYYKYYPKSPTAAQGGKNPNGENPAAAAMYEKCTRLIEAQSQPAQGGRIKKKNTKHNRKTNNKTKKKKYSIRKRRNKKNSRQTKKNRKVKSNRKKRSYRKK